MQDLFKIFKDFGRLQIVLAGGRPDENAFQKLPWQVELVLKTALVRFPDSRELMLKNFRTNCLEHGNDFWEYYLQEYVNGRIPQEALADALFWE